MDRFVEEMTQAGTLLATGGLAPSATQAAGKAAVTHGPFAEVKELIGGFALVRVASRDEAIESPKRYLRIAGDGDAHVRRVFMPEEAGRQT